MKNILFTITRSLLTLQRLILFFFIVILGGVITLITIFYRNNQEYQHTNALVVRTHDVIRHASAIASFSKDIQWESRTFMLTGNKSSLNRYHHARSNLRQSVLHLAKRSSDNPIQQSRVKKLKAQIDSLVDFIDKSMSMKFAENRSLSDFIHSKLNQDIFYSAINEQIEKIIAEESRLLAISEAANTRNARKNYYLFLASGLLIFSILAFAYFLLHYNLKKRKAAEKKLVESEKGFRTLINSIKGLAIFTTDAHGCILNWYAGASKVKGYTSEEVIGRNISIFYTPDAVEKGEPERDLLSAAENGSWETQGWRVRKDGSVFWADILTTAVYDSAGQIKGFTKVSRDFSTHKRAEDEIKAALEKERELNEMKSNFVTIASHEFRTPLSTILTSTALVEQYRTTDTQPKRDKHIQRIKSSVSEMVGILEEFLSLEKIEENRVTPTFQSFNLQQLTEHVCEKFAIPLPGGRIIRYTPGGEQTVFLDKRIVEHILTNLLSNAVKYSAEETEIFVKTIVTEECVKLHVKDYGIGISRADQKHLFERFFRASNTGNIKGTGLGLHIIKRYTDLMKGTIHVESEIGKGSEFIVVFHLPPVSL